MLGSHPLHFLEKYVSSKFWETSICNPYVTYNMFGLYLFSE